MQSAISASPERPVIGKRRANDSPPWRLQALAGFVGVRIRSEGAAINRAAPHKKGGLHPPYTFCVSRD
jgi:hypothetical protein